MKRTLISVLLCLGVGFPAEAQWAASVQTSNREVVRHADGAFQIEYYRTADGHIPSRAKGDIPRYKTEGNTIEWEMPNHPPRSRTGKCWALVKFMPRNTGEIESEQVECSAIDLPFASDLGGYLIDLSQVPAGVHPVGATVKHMGGQNVMQIVIFIFRSQKEVQDQFGFWLHVSDPDLPYTNDEINLNSYMKGLAPTNGAKTYASANEGETYFNRVTGQIEIVVNVFADKERTTPAAGTFYLKSLDGTFKTEPQTGARISFSVPPGQYKLRAAGRDWIYIAPPPEGVLSLAEGEKLEINVRRK